MSCEELIAPFRRVELFHGLTSDQAGEIARSAERIVFQPGQALIRKGAVADAAVLVLDGEAVRTSGPCPSDEPEAIEPGALLAEMAMLVETEHTSTVVAHTRVRALRITRRGLLEQMAADPSLADHFVRQIVGRLRRLATALRSVDELLAVAAR